jgi:hypothetical protein
VEASRLGELPSSSGLVGPSSAPASVPRTITEAAGDEAAASSPKACPNRVFGRSKLSKNGAVITLTLGLPVGVAAVALGAPESVGVLFPGGTQPATLAPATKTNHSKR